MGRLFPVQVTTEGRPNGYTSTIDAIPTKGIARMFFCEVMGQGRVKNRGTICVPIPRLRPFFWNTRNSAITNAFVWELRVRVGEIPLAMFRLIRRNIRTRFVPSFRRFLRPRNNFLLFARATFFARAFRFPMSITGDYASNFYIHYIGVIRRHTLCNFLFKSTYFRTLFCRVKRWEFRPIVAFPIFRLNRYSFPYQLMRLNGGLRAFTTKYRSFQYTFTILFPLPRDFLVKRNGQLLCTREGKQEIVMELFVRNRTATLRRIQFLRYSTREGRKLMTYRHRPVNINVGRRSFLYNDKRTTIDTYRTCPCLCTPST